MNLISVSVFLAVASALVLLRQVGNFSKTKKLPPSPPGWPIFGHLFSLPSEFVWLKFTEWSERYGPIFSLNFAGQRIIVLNNFETAYNLLESRSAISSDRPRSIMVGELMTERLIMPLTPYGELWKRFRRATHESFSKTAVTKYYSIQEFEAAALLRDMIQTPEDFINHYKRSAASMTLRVIYGNRALASLDNPLVHKINEFMERLSLHSRPGAHLVESMPWLLHLPDWLTPWRSKMSVYHSEYNGIFEAFMMQVKADMTKGVDQPSFASELLKNASRNDLTPKEASWLAGSMFAAGSHPTPANLEIFTMAMVLYPQVMIRAQKEIDEVVGRGRLPTFADRRNLPYIECIVQECLRWRSVAPMGNPHFMTEDDMYGEYYIPKGSIVIFNNWAMHRDPTVFPEFEEFRPERYLEATVPIPNTNGHGHGSYGFGRRICPGLHYANAALFIDIACLLWAFDFSKALDEFGEEIVPSPRDFMDEGIVIRPKPFKCGIKCRDPDAKALVASSLVE